MQKWNRKLNWGKTRKQKNRGSRTRRYRAPSLKKRLELLEHLLLGSKDLLELSCVDCDLARTGNGGWFRGWDRLLGRIGGIVFIEDGKTFFFRDRGSHSFGVILLVKISRAYPFQVTLPLAAITRLLAVGALGP